MPRKQSLTGELANFTVHSEEEVTITGAVRGAHLAPHAGLEVLGAAHGTIRLDENSVLVVTGSFTPDELTNDGLVMVAGFTDVRVNDLDSLGRFCLSPGTVIDDQVLDHNGSLRPLLDTNHAVTVEADTWFVWWTEDHRFRSLDDIRAMGADASE